MLLWVSLTGILAAYIAVFLVRISHSRKSIEPEYSSGDALIVFAHPDDETMFFTPTITMLKRIGIKIHLLCLSDGDYDGLGLIRKEEFVAVANELGVAKHEIINDPELADGPREWRADAVVRAVSRYLSRNPTIGAIFTFDGYGVSGHSNHISVFKGISLMKRTMQISQRVHYLRSVNIIRKYLPPVDFVIAQVLSDPTPAVYTDDPFLSLRTMKLYHSQNVWYRKLFTIFSRYSYVNDYISE
jgi:N-acetylglucosaminylphosphatidylinositol deacetylase